MGKLESKLPGPLIAVLSIIIIFSISTLWINGSSNYNSSLGAAITEIKIAANQGGIFGIFSLIQGIFYYLAILIAKPISLIIAFFVLEFFVAGPPASINETVKAFLFRTLQILFKAFLALGFSKLIGESLFDPIFYLDRFSSDIFIIDIILTIAFILLAMIVDDFCTYWAHRFEHKIPILWHFHRVHHSNRNLDAVNSFAHPADQIVSIIAISFVGSIFSFKIENFILLSALKQVHEYLVHTRLPIHFGSFRKVIVDNRYHHFHHSIHYKDYNKNFGTYFTIWDHVFGTNYCPRDDEMVETGVLGASPPQNVWEFISGRIELTGEDDRPQEGS